MSNRKNKNGKHAAGAVSLAHVNINRPPRFLGSKLGMRIHHREYVGKCTGAPGDQFYLASGFLLNPGNPITFPWLSTMANSWQRYTFHALSFDFRSSLPATYGGNAFFGFVADPNDPPPTSYRTLMTNPSATEIRVWDNVSIKAPRSVLDRQPKGGLFVSEGIQLDPAIKRQDTLGVFFQGSNNILAVATPFPQDGKIGDLWIEYDVEFSIPSSPPVHGMAVVDTVSPTPSQPFGTAPNVNNLDGNFLPIVEPSSVYVEKVSPFQVIYEGYAAILGSTVPTFVLENATLRNQRMITDAATGAFAWIAEILPTPESVIGPAIIAIDFGVALGPISSSSAEVLLLTL